MDEVGRGTTVQDGLAIAYGTLHHLCLHNQCRTLFATHFHELADMMGHATGKENGDGIFSTVSFLCTGVDETEVRKAIGFIVVVPF
jgi:DNA mismatch repair ATPase MutS